MSSRVMTSNARVGFATLQYLRGRNLTMLAAVGWWRRSHTVVASKHLRVVERPCQWLPVGGELGAAGEQGVLRGDEELDRQVVEGEACQHHAGAPQGRVGVQAHRVVRRSAQFFSLTLY